MQGERIGTAQTFMKPRFWLFRSKTRPETKCAQVIEGISMSKDSTGILKLGMSTLDKTESSSRDGNKSSHLPAT